MIAYKNNKQKGVAMKNRCAKKIVFFLLLVTTVHKIFAIEPTEQTEIIQTRQQSITAIVEHLQEELFILQSSLEKEHNSQQEKLLAQIQSHVEQEKEYQEKIANYIEREKNSIEQKELLNQEIRKNIEQIDTLQKKILVSQAIEKEIETEKEKLEQELTAYQATEQQNVPTVTGDAALIQEIEQLKVTITLLEKKLKLQQQIQAGQIYHLRKEEQEEQEEKIKK